MQIKSCKSLEDDLFVCAYRVISSRVFIYVVSRYTRWRNIVSTVQARLITEHDSIHDERLPIAISSPGINY